MSRPRAVQRIAVAIGLLLTLSACSMIECGSGTEADRKLRQSIRDGDTEEARRQLDAGAEPAAAAEWSISPGSLVRGEPGDWLGSYLKYHQLLFARFYESDAAMCPLERGDTAQPETARELAEQIGSVAEREAARIARSFEDVTPLHMAAFFCRTEIATLLLDHGANVSARDGAGFTPLHWASCGETAEALIERGADVSAASTSGLTPLHVAIDVDVVRVLLAHGARLDARDRCGNTPLHLASAMGLSFRASDEPLGPLDDDRAMPTWERILVALLDDTMEVVRLLAQRFDVAGAMVNAGADTSATNVAGSTPDQVRGTAGSAGDD